MIRRDTLQESVMKLSAMSVADWQHQQYYFEILQRYGFLAAALKSKSATKKRTRHWTGMSFSAHDEPLLRNNIPIVITHKIENKIANRIAHKIISRIANRIVSRIDAFYFI